MMWLSTPPLQVRSNNGDIAHLNALFLNKLPTAQRRTYRRLLGDPCGVPCCAVPSRARDGAGEDDGAAAAVGGNIIAVAVSTAIDITAVIAIHIPTWLSLMPGTVIIAIVKPTMPSTAAVIDTTSIKHDIASPSTVTTLDTAGTITPAMVTDLSLAHTCPWGWLS